MNTQNVKVNIDGGIVKFYDIQSSCVKDLTFNPWDDEIKITFQSKGSKTYVYHYDKTFQEGFINRVGTEKSLGSFVSRSLKELRLKN